MAMARASAAVIGAGDVIEVEQQFYHLLHLQFVGPTVAGNGLFYLQRFVLCHRETGVGQGQHCHAASMPHGQGGFGVFAKKQLLDG